MWLTAANARNGLTKAATPEVAHLRSLMNYVLANIMPVELLPTFTSSLTFTCFYFTAALHYVYIRLLFFTFPGAAQNNCVET
jgi:hypothetical protein